MNCREFDLHVVDWARGVALDPEVRADAEAHTAGCARCRARLAAEQELTLTLRGVAAVAASGEAPPRLEMALREEFRSRTSTPAPPGLHRKPASPPGLGGWAWAATAAALITGVFFWLHEGRRQTTRAPAPSLVLTAPSLEPPADSPGSAIPVEPAAQLTSENVAAPAPVRRQTASDQSPPPAAAAAGPREIKTAFLPLVHGGQLDTGDRAQLVRVRLPSEALALFGLPVGGDPGEPIPADILLGEDGTARAVRFVRVAAAAEQ